MFLIRKKGCDFLSNNNHNKFEDINSNYYNIGISKSTLEIINKIASIQSEMNQAMSIQIPNNIAYSLDKSILDLSSTFSTSLSNSIEASISQPLIEFCNSLPKNILFNASQHLIELSSKLSYVSLKDKQIPYETVAIISNITKNHSESVFNSMQGILDKFQESLKVNSIYFESHTYLDFDYLVQDVSSLIDDFEISSDAKSDSDNILEFLNNLSQSLNEYNRPNIDYHKWICTICTIITTILTILTVLSNFSPSATDEKILQVLQSIDSGIEKNIETQATESTVK